MHDGHLHFHCSECGTGDFELGYLADDRQFFCEVCIEDGRGLIRLERWPAGEECAADDYSRPGLAA